MNRLFCLIFSSFFPLIIYKPLGKSSLFINGKKEDEDEDEEEEEKER
jgi:hypothetical protein